MGDAHIALVTGGGRGIGAACCKHLSALGFTMAVHYNKSQGPAEELAASLGNAFTIGADLSAPEGAEVIQAKLKEKTGTLAVLVNNAGVVYDNPLFSATLEEFDRTVTTNMRGTWYLTKKLSRTMMRQKSGRIITISSIIGHTGNATQSIYAMTKAALDAFTKTIAVELAPYGILANAIAPGFIDTEMTHGLPPEMKAKLVEKIPLGRVGTPEEVAELVGFLATKGTYCTGTVFHVNGGLYGG